MAAPIAECFAVLEAVDRYPAWYGEGIRNVEVLATGPGGKPSRVRAKLHVSRGPFVRDFDLVLTVVIEPPHAVRMTRATDVPSERRFEITWRLQEAQSTRIDLRLDAKLDVPRFLPLGGIGDGWRRTSLPPRHEIGSQGPS